MELLAASLESARKMKSVNALNKGGCYAGADSGRAGNDKWRIENCVLGDIVADVVFSYHISNLASEFVSAETDLAVRYSVMSLTFTREKTGEEVKVDARIRNYIARPHDFSVFCSSELPDGFAEQLVSDAIDQFNECSVPLICRKAWQSHPRNPAIIKN